MLSSRQLRRSKGWTQGVKGDILSELEANMNRAASPHRVIGGATFGEQFGPVTLQENVSRGCPVMYEASGSC